MMGTVVPKMAANFLSGSKFISRGGCATQVFLVVMVGSAECFLLAVMAYDRYVAVCLPLRYPMLMNWKACCVMALASWMVGVTDSVIYVGMVFSFPYCGSLQVDHFFCEVPTLLRLSCADTSLFQDLIYACCVVMMLLPLGVVVASYARILMAVVNMPSAEGKQKALTTCSSHLTVVGLYYGGGLFNYMQKASARTPAEDRAISTFYTIIAPMLNPLIYSLRNRETHTCWIGSLKYSPILSGQEEHQGLADGVSFPLIKLFLIEELFLLPGDEERMELAALMDPRDTAHLSPPDQSLPPAPPISSSPALGACHPTFFPNENLVRILKS
ncbi:hypothetical protein AB1E18_005751 [Capra hircus]